MKDLVLDKQYPHHPSSNVILDFPVLCPERPLEVNYIEPMRKVRTSISHHSTISSMGFSGDLLKLSTYMYCLSVNRHDVRYASSLVPTALLYGCAFNYYNLKTALRGRR
ncbi:nodulin MtN21 /EamA-like transporter family protein [Striga asiatica]|uniref:Nodulin MtN21 /EamA-like transporter family protein n=1 Tax=Striga asiatica TaxID=4170 RepID=A0A5A7QUX0_STRAF|nr:nodulin MtN21 /EamA-like transporter family protein [Striga asiatica]